MEGKSNRRFPEKKAPGAPPENGLAAHVYFLASGVEDGLFRPGTHRSAGLSENRDKANPNKPAGRFRDKKMRG
jgi:hypothetical protein